MIRSHSLIYSDFNTTWYRRWAKELKQDKNHLNGYKLKANKFWQNAVMVQALYERELLKDGKKCIGFGVGQERLPALFAQYGVDVLATDQDHRTDKAKHWQRYELATGTESLNKLAICAPKLFKNKVSYMPVDMTRIPTDLNGKFDFLWSNCALGHLGSIDAGLKFIIESAKCLKPGGYAIHTTEVNMISNYETLDNNNQTVIFRPRDIYRLGLQLQNMGYELSPLKLFPGNNKQDEKISISPEFGNDYSKLQVGGHLLTQVVLIIKSKPNTNALQKINYKVQGLYSYYQNLAQQKKFLKNNSFLQSIKDYDKKLLNHNSLKAIKKNINITLGNKPRTIYLEYKNVSPFPVFGMHDRFYRTKPIALATSSPIDRKSIFKADDWFNDQANRPSINLCRKDTKNGWAKMDYIKPGDIFAYGLTLDPSKAEKGSYIERFTIVQEDNLYIKDSEVRLNVVIK